MTPDMVSSPSRKGARVRNKNLIRIANTRMKPQTVTDFFKRLSALRPDPKGELDHVKVFTLLVAVVLSAQATDKGVNKATAPLFKVVDTPAKMLALGERASPPTSRASGCSAPSEERDRLVAPTDRRVRRRGAAGPGDPRNPARRRPQDGECRHEHGLGRGNLRRRHPCLPGRQPHRLAPGKTVLEVERKLDKRVPAPTGCTRITG